MWILLGILSVFTFHKAQTLLQWVRNGMVIWNGTRGSTQTAKSGEGDLKPKHGLTAVLPLASITPQQEAVKILRGQKKSGIGYRSRTVQRCQECTTARTFFESRKYSLFVDYDKWSSAPVWGMAVPKCCVTYINITSFKQDRSLCGFNIMIELITYCWLKCRNFLLRNPPPQKKCQIYW